MVFQSYALFPHMTVLENVAYGLTVSGRPKAEARARAEDGLALVGLAGYGQRLPSELSGGQQQRVAVARALVLEPEVLLFDEPLSNLDAKLRRRVREEIRELQQKLGLTSVYVTHDQGEALAVSDRIIVMRDAEIAQAGSPRELYDQPLDLFVADFIGDANLIEAEITAVNGALATVRIGPLTRAAAAPRAGARPRPRRAPARDHPARARSASGRDRGRGREGDLPRQPHGVHGEHGRGRPVRDRPRGRAVAAPRHGGLGRPRPAAASPWCATDPEPVGRAALVCSSKAAGAGQIRSGEARAWPTPG